MFKVGQTQGWRPEPHQTPIPTKRTRGRGVSVLAEQLGGTDVVNANVYPTSTGDLLKPCEMPAASVLAFLRGWEFVT